MLSTSLVQAEITATVWSLQEPLTAVSISITVCGHVVCTGRLRLRMWQGHWVPNNERYMTQKLRAFVAHKSHDAAAMERAVLHSGVYQLVEALEKNEEHQRKVDAFLLRSKP